MKITSDIFMVGGSDLSYSDDAAVYLVTSKNESALIDAGTGKGFSRLIQNINKYGIDVLSIKYLFLTHCHYDHTGGAEKIRKLTGCQIVAHELDATYIEQADQTVTAASWYGTHINSVEIDIKVKGKPKISKLEIRNSNFTILPATLRDPQ